LSFGDIAGLVAAAAFLILVFFLAVPLLKLGGVLDEARRGIRESVDSITPTLEETHVTVTEANKQLERLDTITSNVADVTTNVSSLVSLTAATVGGPLIKIAGFTAAVKAGIGSLRAEEKTAGAVKRGATTPKAPKPGKPTLGRSAAARR